MPVIPEKEAVFLDRDGVLIEDTHLITRSDQVRFLPGAADFVAALRALDLAVFVVTNQTVVSRGLLSWEHAIELNRWVLDRLVATNPRARVDDFRLCPHHPKAQIPQYRQSCDCRKPRPGMLLELAQIHGIALNRSFLVGDRPSDVAAGNLAGCHTIWLKSGQHEAALIESDFTVEEKMFKESFSAETFDEALQYIHKQRGLSA